MSRNANTRARTWAGKWVTLSDEEVPIHEQRATFFSELRPLQEHAEYNVIKYQESDQPAVYHTIHNKVEKQKK